MSAEFSKVIFGLKLTVQPEEVDALKQTTHPYQSLAKQFGLDCDWGDSWLETKAKTARYLLGNNWAR